MPAARGLPGRRRGAPVRDVRDEHVVAQRRRAHGGPRRRRTGNHGDIFTLHVPEGWTFDKTFSTEFIDQYTNPAGAGNERLFVGELSGEVRPLDEVAKANFTSFATTGTQRKRVADAEIAGQPAYHYTAKGEYGVFTEEFGVVREGQQVSFQISLAGSKAERQAVIDSILASWEWT